MSNKKITHTRIWNKNVHFIELTSLLKSVLSVNTKMDYSGKLLLWCRLKSDVSSIRNSCTSDPSCTSDQYWPVVVLVHLPSTTVAILSIILLPTFLLHLSWELLERNLVEPVSSKIRKKIPVSRAVRLGLQVSIIGGQFHGLRVMHEPKFFIE